MEQKRNHSTLSRLQESKSIEDLHYQRRGETSATSELGVREAHARLDDVVESCYPGYPFANDEARLECLFKLYEKMTVNLAKK